MSVEGRLLYFSSLFFFSLPFHLLAGPATFSDQSLGLDHTFNMGPPRGRAGLATMEGKILPICI